MPNVELQSKASGLPLLGLQFTWAKSRQAVVVGRTLRETARQMNVTILTRIGQHLMSGDKENAPLTTRVFIPSLVFLWCYPTAQLPWWPLPRAT